MDRDHLGIPCGPKKLKKRLVDDSPKSSTIVHIDEFRLFLATSSNLLPRDQDHNVALADALAAKSPWCTRVRARTCCEVAGRAAVRLERAALYSNGDWAAPLTQTAGKLHHKLTQTNPLASNTVAHLPQMRCARTLIWRRTTPTALLPLLAAILCPAPLTGQSKMSGATAVVVASVVNLIGLCSHRSVEQ